MKWEHRKGFDVLTIGVRDIGFYHLFENRHRAVLLGEVGIELNNRADCIAYIEKNAVQHHRKLCFEDHCIEPEFKPDLRDLTRRENAANSRRAALIRATKTLEF